MRITVKTWITLAIIIGIGIGTGFLTIGCLIPTEKYRQGEPAIMIGIGATLLAASGAAFIARLAGGFRDIKDDEQSGLGSARSRASTF